MDALRSVRGRAVPLMLHSVDTDVISPMKRLLEGGDALVRYAFEPLRYRPDGSLDPACLLNEPAYRGAPILLCGPNFACGSSRETAVWAVHGMGFRVVIAPSFGDIFFNNCFQNGVLPVALPLPQVEALADEARGGGGDFEVDLEACRVRAPSGAELAFRVHPARREGLLRGLDRIELSLEHEGDITAFQERDRALRPWIYDPEESS